MKTLTKLALISAMAMSGSAFALQTLGDEELSQATGQDGITITLGTATTGIIADAVVIHDSNGVGNGNFGVTTSSAGAIVLGKYGVTGAAGDDFSITGGDIVVAIDADGNANKPVLNVNITLPATLVVNTGEISVATSGGITAAANAQYGGGTGIHTAKTAGTVAKILSNIGVTLTGSTMNIQLGNAPQGAFIKLAGTMATGLQIDNLSIYQPTTTAVLPNTTIGTAGIHIASLNIRSKDAAGYNMTADINANDNGLVISNLGSVDLRLTDIDLGTSRAAAVNTNRIGDVAVLGMTLPNITIGGH
jgi:hypothetical protein